MVSRERRRRKLAQVDSLSPIARPPKFIAIGLNYADHVAEAGLDTPQHPTVFNKQSTCIAGPNDPVHLPRASTALDYEGELGFVIGRRCRHVNRDDAADVPPVSETATREPPRSPHAAARLHR